MRLEAEGKARLEAMKRALAAGLPLAEALPTSPENKTTKGKTTDEVIQFLRTAVWGYPITPVDEQGENTEENHP